MDPNNHNNNNHIFALQKKLDLEHIKRVVQKDFAETNRRTESSVQQVKEDLSNVVPEVLKLCGVMDDDDDENDDDDGRIKFFSRSQSSPEIAEVLKHSITYADRKTKLDAQVMQMFDKSTVEEVKNEVIQKNVDNLCEEFQRAAEDYSYQIQLTKQQIEENIKKIVQLQQDELSKDLAASLPSKVLQDLQDAREKSEALSRRTREEIISHLLVFSTNPQGRKGTEELQSEAIMRDQVKGLENKVIKDILTIKKATDDVTNSTKSSLESCLRQKEEQSKLNTEDLFNFQIRPKGHYSNTVFKTFKVVKSDDLRAIEEDVFNEESNGEEEVQLKSNEESNDEKEIQLVSNEESINGESVEKEVNGENVQMESNEESSGEDGEESKSTCAGKCNENQHDW